ncbi:helix-turn-helix domain-containing protein [uncultured Sunxiuqinia sp.]|uniref:helix-turn-helix domain-containing protein n=1 Tax=uncultured Sunxiuqinia sp. TaxID=1573825 RepID=UPI002AA7630F|nr:helix-turn-helix domain-containing protein [uncultured Sunxiuqinia sp.]
MIEKDLKQILNQQMRLLEMMEIKKGQSAKSKSQDVFTLAQIAEKFSVSIRSIYNWKEQGILPCTVVGSKTYVTQKQLDDFLSQHEVKPIKGWRAL